MGLIEDIGVGDVATRHHQHQGARRLADGRRRPWTSWNKSRQLPARAVKIPVKDSHIEVTQLAFFETMSPSHQ